MCPNHSSYGVSILAGTTSCEVGVKEKFALGCKNSVQVHFSPNYHGEMGNSRGQLEREQIRRDLIDNWGDSRREYCKMWYGEIGDYTGSDGFPNK
jgi:hypothetical protein